MLSNSKLPRKAIRIAKRTKLSGFTLVELIVVVTILAILATIGFLSLSGYSQDATDSAIKANVRSLQTAISSESAITNNSPRYYVVHDPDYALSGAFAYVDGASVALTGGDVGSAPADSNYTAGKPDFKKLKLNPDKFRISSSGLPGGTLGVLARATGFGADSAEASYDASSLMAAGADFMTAGANGKKRVTSYFQAWAVAPATKKAVVSGNFPSSNASAGTVSWLLRAEPGSTTNLTGALLDGAVGSVTVAVAVTVTASSPANCQDIKTATPASPDGVYSIDPDGAGGSAAFQAYCDMTTDGGGWTRVMNLGADTRYFNAKWWQAGSDDITTNSALAALDMKIGPAYQSIGSFSDMLFVDSSASANWVSINSLSISQSLYALVWPSNSVLQVGAKTSSIIPVANASQVRKGGTWDFGNPEAALTFNWCYNGNQSDSSNECVRIGPKFTYSGNVTAWHGLWTAWDGHGDYNSGRSTYKLGILPASNAHAAMYVYVR